MRSASVTIGTLLVLGAATALVNCGGDDSTGTTGTGGTGGSATGGSGGSTGGSGGSGGSTGGASGAGMQDSGADQSSGGSAGAGGSAGKGGAAGSAGAAGAGKAGSSGAGGSAGSGAADSGTGGSAGSGMDASGDGGQCPAMQPTPGAQCNHVEGDCFYGGGVTCSCLDPGPDGIWACHGGPHDGGGTDGGRCPAEVPLGVACPDAGLPIGPCLYDGNTTCTCAVGETEWTCIRNSSAH